MKILILPVLAMLAFALPAQAQTSAMPASVGKPAPDFKGVDTNGKEHKLSDYKGKTVVLEWTNPDCPFVHKHYDSGNMQALQTEATSAGIIWLTIASSATGKEGYYDAAASNKYMTEQKAAATARILDPTGEIGHLYGAKTTPHMFVIDNKGMLVYAGAIDDNDSFKPETIATAKNYVAEALNSLKDGKPVETATSRPYGCSVKYAN